MSFMVPNLRSAFAYLMKLLNPPVLSSSRISLMKKNLFKCSKKWKEWPRARTLSSTKWCGITIANKKPPGNERTIYVRSIPLFTKNGRSFKSQDEISIRGRGCNTLVLSMHLTLAFHEHKHHPSIHEHEHIKFHLIHSIFITCDVAYTHIYACHRVWPMHEMVVGSQKHLRHI